MRGKLLLIGLGAMLLLGLSALIALMGLQPGPEAGRAMPQGTTRADLPDPDGRGAELAARYCRSCHAVPLPSLHTPEEWPAVVEEMRGRMISRVMAPLPTPSIAEHHELVAYFQRYGRAPADRDAEPTETAVAPEADAPAKDDGAPAPRPGEGDVAGN
ncbi:hypothetical protein [Vulgatibacter incomptus]|uniref:Cytochrome c domain-containing protein n=1 Tax=Vulgatibacter incomptus TaxID=1391653 RepID=A0A0K1PIG5_9BACT|nr:hypothetical protein [Vulgatibacter incomptus]AKU92904.1 hypothetical protein AKJ08_3291 [Vulgatibacter incomptus]